MKTIFRLTIFLKPFRLTILLSVFAGIATITSGIGLLGTSAYLLAMAALHPSIAILQVAIVGVRFFGLSRGIFRYIERLSSHSVNLQLLSALRSWLFEKLEHLAPGRLGFMKSGDILAHAVGDIEVLENFYVRIFAPLITALIVIMGMGLFIGTFDPILGYMIMIGLSVSTLVLPFCHYLVTKPAGGLLTKFKSKISSQSVEYLQGLGELMVLDNTRLRAAEILRTGEQMGKAQKSLSNWSGIGNGFLVLLNGLTVWMLLKLTIPLLNSGKLTGVDLTVIILASITSFEAAAPLISASGLLETSLTAAKRLFRLADIETWVNPSIPLKQSGERNSLIFSHINFSYQTNAIPVLSDVSFTLEKGKRIAIVGESGGGKTTIINLLLGFWKADSGEIRLGGEKLDEIQIEEVRANFGLVGSDGWIMRGSIADNLRIAKPDAGDNELSEVIQEVGLNHWLNNLPDGLATQIGESGITISGGQRQRLFIARAILFDAPIMIFDEPTNGLDAVSEWEILQLLFEVTKNRSSLWIMHRLIGLEKMDEIILLDGGKIIERGTYAELMLIKGKFAHMVEVQSGLFLEN